MNSETGSIQVINTWHLISNLGKADKEFSDNYFKYGSIETFIKWFKNDSKKILRASVAAFAGLDLVEKMLELLDDPVSFLFLIII